MGIVNERTNILPLRGSEGKGKSKEICEIHWGIANNLFTIVNCGPSSKQCKGEPQAHISFNKRTAERLFEELKSVFK